MHDAYISRRFWRTKITRKASDTAENLDFADDLCLLARVTGTCGASNQRMVSLAGKLVAENDDRQLTG